MPERFDRAELMQPVSTPEGFLLAEGFAARPGVYQYRGADGEMFRELVTAEVIADRDSLATLGRATVTLTHPPEMIRSDNVQKYGVGDLDGDIEVDDRGFVRIKIAVRREDAVTAVRSGTNQLSCGYIADVDTTPGNHPQFGPYDQRQTSRRYNHLAIVPRGRHGSSVALRADAAAMVCDADTDTHTTKGGPMRLQALIAMLVTAGMTQERADEFGPQILEGFTPDESTKTDAAEELATALGEKRAESIRADAAEAQAAALSKTIDAIDEAAIAQRYIADRAPLEEAAGHLSVEVKNDASNADIRDAIAKSEGIEVEQVGVYVKAINKRPAVKRDARWDGLKLNGKKPAEDASDPWDDNERLDRGETITDKEV